MASSDEFRKALRAGKLTDAFVLAMSKAHQLNITTSIASPEKNFPQSATSSAPRLLYRLRTRLDLVEGKIDNQIDEQFLGNPLYQKVQQFHCQQVNQGHQTIAQNLESLQQMFRLLVTLQKQQIEGNYREFGWLDVATESLPGEKAIAKNDTATPPAEQVHSDISGAAAPAKRDRIPTPTSVESDLDRQQEEETEAEQTTIESREAEAETQAYILSLEDLEENEEVIPTEGEEEDWGDWLEEDDTALLDLASLEGEEESEEWQEGKKNNSPENRK
ncbi:hypothetical protein IQ238_01725 [Pleurocapsales cyanobacterium LEGE 06147]|nr:hypothetical protein [Pleurocapsales cyanobacterium LEGE 06147]